MLRRAAAYLGLLACPVIACGQAVVTEADQDALQEPEPLTEVRRIGGIEYEFPPRQPAWSTSWRGERPAFVRSVSFTDAAYGKSRRLGMRRSNPWLVVHTDNAPQGRRLCADWSPKPEDLRTPSCQLLSSGLAAYSFEGPRTVEEGDLEVRLFTEPVNFESGETEPVGVASYRFAAGSIHLLQTRLDDGATQWTWENARQNFLDDPIFLDGPWGEPVRRTERGDLPIDLWLAVPINGAPEGADLCVVRRGDAVAADADECQAMPSGPAVLSFPGPFAYDYGTVMARLELRTSGAEPVEIGRARYSVGRRYLGLLGNELTPGPDPDATAPEFPWPPPRSTTLAVFDRAMLPGRAFLLEDVAYRLTDALKRSGYDDHSFYPVPGGFAIATRLEQIEEDGTPKPEPARWDTAPPRQEIFSLADFIRALFTAPEGHYRVIVFVVSDQPFSSASEEADADEAESWLSGGLNRLPDDIAYHPVSDSDFVTAIVYQFSKSGFDGEPVPNPEGARPARQQLTRSGIMAALATAR